MNTQETHNNFRSPSQKAIMSRGAAFYAGAAVLGIGALTLTIAPAAQAQTSRHSTSLVVIREVGSGDSHPYQQVAFTGASANVPDSLRPVMFRAAAMLEAARARQSSAPNGARQSYQAAATALRQALAAGHYGPSSSGSTNPAGIPMSSSQIADDIRTIKSAAQSASPNQSAALQRIATLYATGAKEFFTGQLRDALLSSDSGAIVIRGRGTGTTSSALLGRTVTPRGVQQGGIIQPDGTVVAVPANTGGLPNIAAPGADPNTTTISDAPPSPLAPVVTGTALSPLSPTAPIIVTQPGIANVVTAPVSAPPIPVTENP